MSRRGLGVYAFFIVLFGVFCYFANRFDYFPGDVAISQWLQGFDVAWPKPIMRFAPYIVDLAILVALRLWLPSRQLELISIVIAAIATTTAGWFLKLLVGRPRPDGELVQLIVNTHWLGFPSLHVALATIIGGFAFYLAPRLFKSPQVAGWLRALLIAIVLAIGVSRIYLGAHWASDVVGGLVLGGLVLYPSIVLYNKYDATRGEIDAGVA